MKRENKGFARQLLMRIGLVVVATAAYGAVLAAWRSPLMAAYVAVKLPVVFVASTLIVSGFCWMAGLVTGADLRYGEVLDSVFAAMAIAGSILLALAPVVFFFIISGAPDAGTAEEMLFAHACMMLVHVLVFAGAGVVGNALLYKSLKARVPARCKILLMMGLWLASFAFVGCASPSPSTARSSPHVFATVCSSLRRRTSGFVPTKLSRADWCPRSVRPLRSGGSAVSARGRLPEQGRHAVSNHHLSGGML